MQSPTGRVGLAARRSRRWPAKARRALPRNGGPLEHQLNPSHVAAARLDAAFAVLWANPAFTRLIRPGTGEFAPGANFFDLFPDDGLLTIFQEVLDSATPQTAYGHPLPPLLGEPALTYWDISVQPYQGGLLLVLNDATTRENAIHAFEQAQALFVHLFESAPDANLLVDQHGDIQAANQQAEALFGYSKHELIGRSVESLIPDEQRGAHPGRRAAFWQSMQKRPLGSGAVLTALRKDGAHIPVDIILSPLRTERGPVVLCVVHDLTNRVADQKALQAQTALVALLQEITAAANQNLPPREAFQVALDRICAFLGWPAGHAYLIKRDATFLPVNIWSSQMPASLDAFRALTESITFQPGDGLIGDVMQTGQPVWLNNPHEQANFRRKQMAIDTGLKTAVAVPVLADREVVAVLEFFTQELLPPDPALLEALPHVGVQLGRVIERQRAAEALNKRAAQLRTVVSNLPVILMALDQRGRITFLDGRGLEATGRRPGDMLGQSIYELIAPQHGMREALEKSLQGRAAHVEVSAFANIYEVFFSPYRDGDGKLEGVITLALDVTERVQMEAELEEIKHHLMESVETERIRLAEQLHDGPLQDLYGVFYQVQEVKSLLPAGETAGVEAALDTIQRVNATLRFICGELRPTTLAHLGLKMAMRSHVERLQERYPNIHIHLDLEDDAQQLHSSQRLGLYRIYQHLVNNVVRHAQARHAWVRLKLLPDSVVLEVQDNGQGFEMPRSWVELVRGGRFGLTGAQERAAALGGDLEVISRPGSGTLARVVIPRKQP